MFFIEFVVTLFGGAASIFISQNVSKCSFQQGQIARSYYYLLLCARTLELENMVNILPVQGSLNLNVYGFMRLWI